MIVESEIEISTTPYKYAVLGLRRQRPPYKKYNSRLTYRANRGAATTEARALKKWGHDVAIVEGFMLPLLNAELKKKGWY